MGACTDVYGGRLNGQPVGALQGKVCTQCTVYMGRPGGCVGRGVQLTGVTCNAGTCSYGTAGGVTVF